MIKDLLFPTPVYIFDIKDKSLNIELEKNILNWMNQDKGISRTNIKGWHSTTDMHQKPEYQRLVKSLFEAQFIVYKEEHYEGEPFLGNMWANVNPPGSMNRAHIHSNSLWSGVYYVKTPENSGLLQIEDTRTQSLMTRPNLKPGETPEILWRQKSYLPVAGRCIMFPSWVNHCVDPNESNELRISVSFNFLQKGMFV